MKNFIFATVSGLALVLAYPALAEDAPAATPEASAPVADPAAAAPKAAAPLAHKSTAHHHKHAAHAHANAHHHHHKAHPMGHYAAEVGGVYVTFPPFDECGRQVCAPSYYWGNPEYAYQYHGGYFWYPHARGNLLPGYSPYNYQNMYWYASRMHPHMVYVDRAPLVFTHPYAMYMPHPMDGAMQIIQPAPMQGKWDGAPVVAPAIFE